MTRPHNAEELYKITLRVNRDLLEEIRQLAERDHRSVNSYLQQLVRREAAALMKPNKKPR